MKTITNIDLTACANLSDTMAAKKAADKAYDAAKSALAKSVADYLNTAPEGTRVLNMDLARATGLTPAHTAAIISSEGHGLGVRSDSMTVVTRYAEVDEDGKLVEGGRTKEVQRDLCAFRKANKRGW